MNRITGSRAFVRIAGALLLVAGLIELVMVYTRAHLVISLSPPGLGAGSLTISPLTFVTQIGLLVVGVLIGIVLAGVGVRCCFSNQGRSADS